MTRRVEDGAETLQQLRAAEQLHPFKLGEGAVAKKFNNHHRLWFCALKPHSQNGSEFETGFFQHGLAKLQSPRSRPLTGTLKLSLAVCYDPLPLPTTTTTAHEPRGPSGAARGPIAPRPAAPSARRP